MSADKSVQQIMARRGLSDEQKAAIIAQIRSLAKSLSQEVRRGPQKRRANEMYKLKSQQLRMHAKISPHRKHGA